MFTQGFSIKKGLVAAGCFGVMMAGSLMFGQDKGDAAKGKSTFEDNCAVCHNADSEEVKMGPGLKGLFKHEKLKNGKKPGDATIRAIINEGGNGMPSFSDVLTDAEKSNVIAYLKTL
jgi:mono/diheme cytochrome c family protein